MPFNPYYLYAGSSWGTNQISYSFLTSVPAYYADASASGIPAHLALFSQPLSEVQRAAVEAAMGMWSAVANISWVPVVQTAESIGSVTFAGFSSPYLPLHLGFNPVAPVGEPSALAGDVWFNTLDPQFQNTQIGGHSVYTMLHEIGHALGLAHDGTTAPTNPSAAPLPQAEANLLYTVMAYDIDPDPGSPNFGDYFPFVPESIRGLYPVTPMMYDIAQIQELYGASASANGGVSDAEGNTIWIFSDSSQPFSRADMGIYNDPGNVLMTLWDPFGNDGIDARGISTQVFIDLHEGQFSDIGTHSGQSGALGFSRPNVGIALGATIENAYGGSGDDTLIGNEIANVLDGGSGKDLLVGAEGDDVLEGGKGDDFLEGNEGNDMLDGGADNDSLAGGEGNDHLLGGLGDDGLDGGSGDDVLSGQGGFDELVGGKGFDTYFYDSGSGAVVVVIHDMDGAIVYDSLRLTGGHSNPAVFGRYDDDFGNIYFWPGDGGLSINSGLITVPYFSNGDLGIWLINPDDQPAPPSNPVPNPNPDPGRDPGDANDPRNQSNPGEPPFPSKSPNPQSTFEDTKSESPIVLDLNRDGIGTIAVNHGAHFDHDGNGFAEGTGWVNPHDGILVRDRNGDGRISSGNELFGSATILADGTKASNGFVALAELDANSDGVIDSSDLGFADLKIWIDSDGNGYSSPWELESLSDAGVVSINLAYTNDSVVDSAGNEHRQIGTFTRTDGATGAAEDIWFQRDVERSLAEEWLMPTPEIARLPDLRGSGVVYDLHQAMIRNSAGELTVLVESFVAEDSIAGRENLFEQILFQWAGVEAVDPSSRGVYIDARKLAVLEQFVGRPWIYPSGDPNPGPDAGLLLMNAYDEFYEQRYAELVVQAQLRPYFHLVKYRWDSDRSTLATNVDDALDVLRDLSETNASLGTQLTQEFIRISNTLLPMAIGSDADDQLESDASAQTLLGLAGNDVLYGEGGNDELMGGDGEDSLYGGDGDDVLNGGADNDVLSGDEGNDIYVFGRGSGQDTILNYDASAGHRDVVRLAADVLPTDVKASRSTLGGDDLYLSIIGTQDRIRVANFFHPTASPFYAIDAVVFADGTEWNQVDLRAAVLLGDDQANNLYGYETDDLVQGLGGDDQLFGRDGDDQLVGGDGNDELDGGSGNDALAGGDGADFLDGGDGGDSLLGGAGQDNLYGGAGDDVLDGGAGDDTLSGGAGNDTYRFGRGSGQDILGNFDNSEGRRDVVEIGADVAPVEVKVGRSAGGGDDLYLSIEGTDDRLRVVNFFHPGSGASYSIDAVRFADGTEWTQSDLRGAALIGDSEANNIYGYEGDDVLQGLAGDDQLFGRDGSDQLLGGDGGDQLDGGDGNDTLDAGQDNDSLDGGDGDDLLLGGAGQDNLYAGAGDDVLDGGAGDDILVGNLGNDTYRFGRGSDQDTLVNYDDSEGRRDVVEMAADVLPEDVVVSRSANGGDDLYLSIAGTEDRLRVVNFFHPSSGATYSIDAVRFADGTEWSQADLRDMTELSIGTSGEDDLAVPPGVDAIQGLGANDTISAGNANSVVDGGAGNDSIQTGDGSNIITGGGGDDAISTGSGTNIIAFNAGDGTDTVQSAAGASNTLSLGGGIGYDDLSLTKNGDDLVVNAGSDQVAFKDWYAGKDDVANLQVILDASSAFDANSSDPLYNRRVQNFDFRGLVGEFDEVLAQSPGMSSWAVTNALLQFHLSGSDDSALGGDLAYWYGKNDALTGMSLASAQQVLTASTFGSEAQTLHPFTGLQEGLVKLT